MSLKIVLYAISLAALLSTPLSPCARVSWAAGEEESPSELARQGMERLLRAIELMLEMIPQYEAPEVLENGDIIIRRKNPPPPKDESEESDGVDQTRI